MALTEDWFRVDISKKEIIGNVVLLGDMWHSFKVKKRLLSDAHMISALIVSIICTTSLARTD